MYLAGSDQHLSIQCNLTTNSRSLTSFALVDCGATAESFVDPVFAHHVDMTITPLEKPFPITAFDGEAPRGGFVSHSALFTISIGEHTEDITAFLTPLGRYPIILGIGWLRKHDPSIRFSSNTIIFSSEHCLHRCLPSKRPCIVPGLSEIPRSFHGKPAPVSAHHDVQRRPQISMISAPAMLTAVHHASCQEAGRFSIRDLDSTLRRRDATSSLSASDDAPTDDELRQAIPAEYHKWIRVFSPREADTLPPHRPYDHKIPLLPGKQPPFGPLYPMSHEELKALRSWLDENLQKGFIRQSCSPAASPVLFVKKKDGSLRLCVDYRGLNAITVKSRYPIPLISETLTKLSRARFYTRFDIISAFNRLRIAEGDEWLTAFRTRWGLFESLVMPFGLSGAPGSFQLFINDVLRAHLDDFVTAYLDDILIFSETLGEHRRHVSWVLDRLHAAGLQISLKKTEFHVTSTKFLGLVISRDGVSMDPEKVKAIVEWQTPSDARDVQSFLGFSNFYRRFVRDFSGLAAPLNNLTKKGVKFTWGESCQAAFDTLKSAFISAPILQHFDYEKPIVLETDSSDYVSAGVLSQTDDSGLLHPVAFFSKKLSPTECNYEIYDKELLAIIRCFEEWRPELEGAASPIQVITDHRNLEYFMSTRNLNRRQARWSEFLSRFQFQILYRPGKFGAKPDSLTRRSQDLPGPDDPRLQHQSQVVIKSHNLSEFPDPRPPQDPASLDTIESASIVSAVPDDPALSESDDHSYVSDDHDTPEPLDAQVSHAYDQDPDVASVLRSLREGAPRHGHVSLSQCSERDGRLYYNDRLWIPVDTALRARLLHDHHNSPVAGHPGRAKTYELLFRRYYWPRMHSDVSRWVRNCHTCRRSKDTRDRLHGTLRTLPVPARPWTDVSVDFITGLETSHGFDAIMVVVDRLSKMRHFIPCRAECSAAAAARFFVDHVWKIHGLPSSIVSDRGPQFVSRFWDHLARRLRVRRNLSTSYHPQTDGQTERLNAILEAYLRAYVAYLQDDWADWLALAEFATNNHVSSTTGVSPFFAVYGTNPRFDFGPVEPASDRPSAEAESFASHMERIHDHLRSEMTFAQEAYAAAANVHRTPAPSYKPGDLVWVNSKNIRTLRPRKKLDWKNLGPFKVIEPVGTHAYRLELPPRMRYHPVFHVSLLRPASNDPVPGQVQPPPPPIEVDNHDEWQVEDILDKTPDNSHFLVQWVGYEEPTWEPYEHVQHLTALLQRLDSRLAGLSPRRRRSRRARP